MSRYHVEEVDSAARNLNDILDVICQLQFDVDRDAPADRRIDSLLWVARDVAEGIIAHLDRRGAEALQNIKKGRV